MPGIAHLNPSEAERMLCPVRQLKLYLWDSERIWGVPTAVVHSLEPLHQRHHEKSYQQMDHGDLSINILLIINILFAHHGYITSIIEIYSSCQISC